MKDNPLVFSVKHILSILLLVLFTIVNAEVVYHPPLNGDLSDKFLINVERDRKVGNDSKLTESGCPTDLYINGKRVDSYLIYEQQQYYLSPGLYTFRVENCLGQESIYDMDLSIDSNQYYQNYLLSVDFKGKPFIIKNTPKSIDAVRIK